MRATSPEFEFGVWILPMNFSQDFLRFFLRGRCPAEHTLAKVYHLARRIPANPRELQNIKEFVACQKPTPARSCSSSPTDRLHPHRRISHRSNRGMLDLLERRKLDVSRFIDPCESPEVPNLIDIVCRREDGDEESIVLD